MAERLRQHPEHPMSVETQADKLPVGPIQDDACDKYKCSAPRAEHRDRYGDLREDKIDHDYEEPPVRPYDHERVPCAIVTLWRCHVCGHESDVWGTGAEGGYMECQSDACDASSWLDFAPDKFFGQAVT